MSVKIDLTGKRFGKLTVVGLAVDVPYKKKKWLCKCDCGNEAIVAGSNLQSGHTKNCIECGRKTLAKSKTTHGRTHTKLYYIWHAMINRCENPSFKYYADYGGRGISVCEEWHDAKVFIKWAEENGYEEDLQIDRKDNDGNYCPDNCRWVTKTINANNKRNNKIIEHNGEKKTLAEWARFYDVNYRNLFRNLNKGYSLEEAVKREKTGDRTHRGSKNWNKKMVAEAKTENEPQEGLFGEE